MKPDILKPVRECVNGHKRNPELPEPTRCPHCGYIAAEIVCHICKTDKLIEDEL